MTKPVSDVYLNSVTQAIESGTPEQIEAYFASLKKLPGGDDIIDQINERIIANLLHKSFPTHEQTPRQDGFKVVFSTFADFPDAEVATTPDFVHHEQTFSSSDLTCNLGETLEPCECGEMDYCEDDVCQPEPQKTTDLSLSIWAQRVIAETEAEHLAEQATIPNRLADMIQDQRDEAEMRRLGNLLVDAINATEDTTTIATGRIDFGAPTMGSTLASRAIKEQLAVKAAADEATQKQERLSKLIDDTLTMMHGHSDPAELTFTKEDIIESILDAIAVNIVFSGMIEDTFVINESSIELYEYYFRTMFYSEVFETGLGEDYEYQTEYTAYIMTELSHYFAEKGGYELAYKVEADRVYPVLKATK